MYSGRPWQIAVAIAACLVLVVTGAAWRSVDALQSSLASVRGLALGDGEDGAVDILLVGTDSRTDAHGNPLSQRELDALRAGEEVANNTDTIILIRVPNDGRSATAMSIPRDTYVEVPEIGMSKINAAYGATKANRRAELVEADADATEAELEKESTQAGREALIESVADLTGVTVDHYAEVGLLGFVLLTDAVGGVEVCLNAPVDEPLSGARFDAGEQTLQGSDALSFVRQRHDLPRGDLDRIVRQQVFMASLAQKVLSAKTLSNPSKVSQLTAAVQRSVVLDSDWDIMALATQLQGLAGGDVTFSTIPVQDINAMTDYGESVVQVDPDEVRSFVAELIGREPDGSETTSTPVPAPDIDASTVTVDVANADPCPAWPPRSPRLCPRRATSRARWATTPVPVWARRRSSVPMRTPTRPARWPRRSVVSPPSPIPRSRPAPCGSCSPATTPAPARRRTPVRPPPHPPPTSA